MSLKGLIHHLEIYVRRLDQSKELWGWLLYELGYKLDQEWTDGCSWRLGNTYIVLVQVAARHAHRLHHRSGVGVNHIALHAGSRNDVDRLTEELEARGMRILYRDRHPYAGGPNHYAVFFEDPDRMKVELVASDM